MTRHLASFTFICVRQRPPHTLEYFYNLTVHILGYTTVGRVTSRGHAQARLHTKLTLAFGHINACAFFSLRGSLTPFPRRRRSEKSGCGCTRHPRSTKPLLWKCCQIHRLLSQVTAERRLRTCRPSTRSEHKVSADARAISPLQLTVTLENSTSLPEMLSAIQFLMSGTS